LTNAIDIESAVVRVLMLAAAAGSFFLAIALPHAFGDDGLRFALAYCFVRVLHVGLYSWGLRADPVHRAALLRLAPWFLVAPAVALAGGFAEGDARIVLWTASLAIDVGGTLSLGSRNGFRVSPSHFAERYALFVIIALGESVVAVGASVVELPRDAVFFVSVLVAFALVCALWWAYFDFSALAAERALRLASTERRGALARDVFTLFHFPTVLGIVYIAVAAEHALHDPSHPLAPADRAALALGVGVYLCGFVLARLRAARRVAWERLGGAAAVAVLAVVGADLDAIWLLGLATVIVVAATAAETARMHEVRARVRSHAPPVEG
jgi:low temperature requirement protein LtrA